MLFTITWNRIVNFTVTLHRIVLKFFKFSSLYQFIKYSHLILHTMIYNTSWDYSKNFLTPKDGHYLLVTCYDGVVYISRSYSINQARHPTHQPASFLLSSDWTVGWKYRSMLQQKRVLQRKSSAITLRDHATVWDVATISYAQGANCIFAVFWRDSDFEMYSHNPADCTLTPLVKWLRTCIKYP